MKFHSLLFFLWSKKYLGGPCPTPQLIALSYVETLLCLTFILKRRILEKHNSNSKNADKVHRTLMSPQNPYGPKNHHVICKLKGWKGISHAQNKKALSSSNFSYMFHKGIENLASINKCIGERGNFCRSCFSIDNFEVNFPLTNLKLEYTSQIFSLN